ncbi:glycosyltransferase [uncultured Cedecea sp.]|uniref:glycosyltransferase family 8 protein n=1 Tax=uncultured Cedecea sp. TaxID=988762 RepID=UPI002633D379|nr:glycosyltransferase [uncultured Cedecea sp.]
MKKIINATISIGEQNKDKAKINHIAYGVDKNFLFGTGISLVSVLINNKEKFHFHIFTDFINQDYIEKCKQITNKFETQITLYLINTDVFSQLPVSAIWPKAMYFRLAIFDILSEVSNKLLYLDADIVCKGSLSDFFNTDLSNHYAAVVADLDAVQNRVEQRLGIAGMKGKYFNSGVILANLQEWKENNLTEKCFTALSDETIRKKLHFMDQDLLNILLFNHTIILDNRYNCIYDGSEHFGRKDYANYKETITDNTVLIHYTSDTKPWLKWVRYPAFAFFDNALAQSPWSDKDLMDASRINQLKKKSKHEFYQGKHLSGIKTQLKYLWKKVVH